MSKYQKLWWLIWAICLILCLTHYGYMLFSAADTSIIHTEHLVYLLILALAAVSVSSLKTGKILLWVIIFCGLATFYSLPELQKITAFKYCAEGKCLD